MRILDLQLQAFGPFTEQSLELNPEANLHVIYGPNESGKSSTLRALRVLFYGFARQTRENFLHPSQKLQVGGRFLNGSGEPIELVRLKRNKASLVNPQGEPVGESTLERLLGGLSPEMFDRLYGLSHSSLVSGGKALIQVGGKVGESLFAASLGPEYQNLVNQLRKEHEAIWTSRSSAKPLDEWIRRWEEAETESRRQALPAESWLRCREDLDSSRRESRRLKSEYAQLDARRERFQRLLKAAPGVARRKELLESLSSFGELPELSEEFSSRRSALQTEIAVARKRLQSLEQDVTETREATSKLGERNDVLDAATRIEALFQKVGVITKHSIERPQLDSDLRVCRASISKLLQTLGRSDRGEGLPTLPSGRWRAEARKRAQEHLRLDAARRETLKGLEAVETAKRSLEEVPKDGAEERKSKLEQALQLALHESGLDERMVKLLSEVRAARSSVELELEKLPCWSGTLEELVSCRVPSLGMVEQAEGDLSTARQSKERAESELEERRERLHGLAEELRQFTSGRDLFTLGDLEASRAEREELWSDIYHAWRNEDSPEDVRTVVSRYADSVQNADHIADEIIASGEQLLQLEHLKEQQRTETGALEKATRKLEECERALKDAQSSWEALWSGTGVLVGTPRQMLSWLPQRAEILRQAKRIEHREMELAAARQDLNQEIEKLSVVAVECGLESFDQARGLQPALQLVEQRVEELRRLLAEREATSEKRRDLLRQGEEQQERKEALEGELQDWERQWEEFLESYPFQPKPRPENLEDVLVSLEELAEQGNRENQLSERSEGLQAELVAFAREADSLKERVTTEPDWNDVQVVEAAQRELRSALETEKERERLRLELQKREKQRGELKEELETLNASLEQLLREAQVDSENALAEREREVLKKRELSKELQLLEKSLRDLSGSDGLSVFCLAVEEADLDRIPGELEILAEEMARKSEEQERSVTRVGELKHELESLDGTSRAAELGQEAAAAEAKGRELLDRYVRLVLAERLLTDQMEQYRRQNEGPVLERAGDYFRRLTKDKYQSLQTGFDRKGGDLVLHAVSASGREVPIDGLSDGTCDQLFLALRLATVARSTDSGGRLPVVADDVLVQFDDERAAAALQTLMEFSSLTQVLLFTHLERDRDLALAMKDPRVDVIELSPLKL